MSKISSGTTTATGLVQTSDTTGNLELQTNNGTTAVTFDTNQNASFAGDVSINNGNYLSSQPTFRNLIINGDMRIAQRGTSAAGITGSSYNTCDRWRVFLGSLGTWTQSQSTDVPSGQGFSSSLKMECTTADASPSASDELIVAQSMEGQNLQYLKFGTSSAESLTASFWVKSNKTGTYICELFHEEGSNDKTINKSYTINTADTWEKKTITFAGDTAKAFDNDNALTLNLSFWLGAGSNFTSGTLATSWETRTNANRAVGQVNLADSTSNYINITGCQLEIGSTATPFEHRPYDVELARCQRYCWQHTAEDNYEIYAVSACYSTSNSYAAYKYPVKMRVSPTVSFSATSDFQLLESGAAHTCTSVFGSEISSTSCQLDMHSTSNLVAGNAALIRANNVATDGTHYIRFDAEL